MTEPREPDTEQPKPRPLRHDAAGQAYTASVESTSHRLPRPDERVASRSTEEEARDLLALRRAKRGDTAAFAELIQSNDAAVRSLVGALIGPSLLDQVCTQTYLRAYRGLPIAPATAPRLWLLGLADGAAQDAIRRASTTVGSRGEKPDPPIPLDLPAEQRLVVAAVDGAGLTVREAARLASTDVRLVRELLAAGRGDPETTNPLPAPGEHGRGFWDDLGRRLLIERSAPAVARHPGDDPRDEPRPAGAGRNVESGRAARGMAERVAQQHPRQFPWHRALVATGIVLTVVVLIGVALSVAHHASTRDAGLGETATKVLDKLDAALANDAVIRGDVTITSRRPAILPSGSYRFIRSDTGSWQLVSTDGHHVEGYDVPTATFTTAQSGAGTTPRAHVRTGVAPGPPEVTAVSPDALGDLLADSVRVVRAGSRGTVVARAAPTSDATTTTAPDQQWVVTSALDATARARRPTLAGTGALAKLGADDVTLIADQSFALPVELVLREQGRTIAQLRFSGLAISQQPHSASFAPAPPAGAPVTQSQSGFVPTELGKLNTGGSGSVPTPSYLPSGYVLAATAQNPTTKSVVLCYRNGSRQLVLTLRPTAPGRAAETDPFSPSKSAKSAKSDVASIQVSSGKFAGRRGWTSESPLAHVWITGSGTEVIAAGDPSTDQLVRVIASLS